eukprot:TRINITY_DN8612_c0_g1_i1.p1 TRINITY_DN8612_c0_g1~~TRINITY_DN8612_c0_g1_i1.p1  ORF type:complete len:316 (+),score=81.55 TRINITY_DN8612_c0_g1_i1:159-1106(+)
MDISSLISPQEKSEDDEEDGAVRIVDTSAELFFEEMKKAEDARIFRLKKCNQHVLEVEEQVKIASSSEIVKKRRKAPFQQPGATAKPKRFKELPRDENGKPVMPIQLRGFTILSLGKIVTDKPKFHSKRYIWPVGFKSTRSYMSTKELDKRCMYTNEILDDGEEPKFKVSCDDGSDPVIGATSSGAWAEVGRRVCDLRESAQGKRMFTQISGPEMFGYSHPAVVKLIQEMEGARECKSYQFVSFSETPSASNTPPARAAQTKDEKGEEETKEVPKAKIKFTLKLPESSIQPPTVEESDDSEFEASLSSLSPDDED